MASVTAISGESAFCFREALNTLIAPSRVWWFPRVHTDSHSGTQNGNPGLEDLRKPDPDLPVIVVSRTGEEKEWIEVIEVGAFDLLVPPYCERTVLPVPIQAAVSREARANKDFVQPLRARVS